MDKQTVVQLKGTNYRCMCYTTITLKGFCEVKEESGYKLYNDIYVAFQKRAKL